MRRHDGMVMLLDSDGRNPYSREIFDLFSDAGQTPRLIAPADSPYREKGSRLVLRRTMNVRSGFLGRLAELTREASTMTALAWHLARGSQVIIVWARTYQEMLLVAISWVSHRRPIFVFHNPSPGRFPHGWRGAVRRALLRRSLSVVHGEVLVAAAVQHGAERVVPIPHVSFSSWRRAVQTFSGASAEHIRGQRSIVLAGAIRADKFGEVEIAKLISALELVKFECTLMLCVRPSLVSLRTSDLRYVQVQDHSASDFISDEVLFSVLGSAQLLVAPYSEPTESGTVVLARTLGLGVVGFTGGVLQEYLDPKSLVDTGDWAALANQISEWFRSPWPDKQDVAARDALARERWLSVVGDRSIHRRIT